MHIGLSKRPSPQDCGAYYVDDAEIGKLCGSFEIKDADKLAALWTKYGDPNVAEWDETAGMPRARSLKGGPPK